MNGPLGGFLKTEDFILKNLPPKMFPSIKALQEHAVFWMSDHARFWYYKEENEFMTFPSILLTDTAQQVEVLLSFVRCYKKLLHQNRVIWWVRWEYVEV